MERRDLDELVLALMAEHGCHTGILYGSWARGDATAESDVDILCVREAGPPVRAARMQGAVYLDGFVYPESSLERLDPDLLRILGGRVVKERDGFGTRLLERLKEQYDRGPEPMSEDERAAIRVWSRKMVERIRGQHGIEADYRRTQLVFESLEDYFRLRNSWYNGPKASFQWLRQHDPAALHCFEQVAGPGRSDEAFDALVRAVYS